MRAKAMFLLIPLMALLCLSYACDNEGGAGGCFPAMGDVATFRVRTQVNNYLTSGFTVTVKLDGVIQSSGQTDVTGTVILYADGNGTATVCAYKGLWSAQCETLTVWIGQHYNIMFKWYGQPVEFNPDVVGD